MMTLAALQAPLPALQCMLPVWLHSSLTRIPNVLLSTVPSGGGSSSRSNWGAVSVANSSLHTPMGSFTMFPIQSSQVTKCPSLKVHNSKCIRWDGWCCWCRLCKYVNLSVGCLGVGEAARGEQSIANQGQEWMSIRTTSKRSWFSK